jgi:hypothetical protein
MDFYDDTNSLILNLTPRLIVNPVAARLVFFFFCLAPFTLYQKPVIIALGLHHNSINGMQRINYFLLHFNCHREGAALGSLPPHTSEPLSPQDLFELISLHEVSEPEPRKIKDIFLV